MDITNCWKCVIPHSFKRIVFDNIYSKMSGLTGYLTSGGIDLSYIFQTGTTTGTSGYKIASGADLNTKFLVSYNIYFAQPTGYLRTTNTDLSTLYHPRPTTLGAIAGGVVNSIQVVDDTHIYLCGTFTSIGGVSTPRLAMWNGTGFVTLGTTNVGGNFKYICAVSSTRVYVVGFFTTITYNSVVVSSNYVALWNGTGWSSMSGAIPVPTATSHQRISAIASDTLRAHYICGTTISYLWASAVNTWYASPAFTYPYYAVVRASTYICLYSSNGATSFNQLSFRDIDNNQISTYALGTTHTTAINTKLLMWGAYPIVYGSVSGAATSFVLFNGGVMEYYSYGAVADMSDLGNSYLYFVLAGGTGNLYKWTWGPTYVTQTSSWGTAPTSFATNATTGKFYVANSTSLIMLN